METVKISLNKKEAKIAKHYAATNNMSVAEAMKDVYFSEIIKFYLESEDDARSLLKTLGIPKEDK